MSPPPTVLDCASADSTPVAKIRMSRDASRSVPAATVVITMLETVVFEWELPIWTRPPPVLEEEEAALLADSDKTVMSVPRNTDPPSIVVLTTGAELTFETEFWIVIKPPPPPVERDDAIWSPAQTGWSPWRASMVRVAPA